MPGKRVSEHVRREQILRAAFEVASREGIGSLTIRGVAAEAKVSHALVLFHFERKARLVHELLDWLIETTSVLHVSEDIARFPRGTDRLHALLQQEMARLSHQPRHTRLFFEFWALGARHETIRVRISAELERYRSAFRSIMEELLLADPATFAGVTADGLAAVAVSWIHGCAVQAMVDPGHFDTDEYLAAVRGMVGQLASA
ncbi:MAG TPA: TetR family transcriptional regulator C-terminal domain-containing protein [Longimicrobiaceae bacterium]|nr:TetR family transcriptional regulator C-terminal domain-containing protein [Longimicrobiaceae bacterium]